MKTCLDPFGQLARPSGEEKTVARLARTPQKQVHDAAVALLLPAASQRRTQPQNRRTESRPRSKTTFLSPRPLSATRFRNRAGSAYTRTVPSWSALLVCADAPPPP